MTAREDIVVDALEQEVVFFCKKCGRPFAGMAEAEIEDRKSNGTFDEESDRIIDAHLRTCRRAGAGAL